MPGLGAALYIEEVLTVGKKVRIAVSELGIILETRSDFRSSAAAIGDGCEWAGNSGSEDDGSAVIPGAAAAVGGIAESLRGAAGGENFLELAIGKEAEVFAIGRPEGKDGAFGAGE